MPSNTARPSPPAAHPLAEQIERVVRGQHHDPHQVLGPHLERVTSRDDAVAGHDADAPARGPRRRVSVRTYRPDATEVTVLLGDEKVPCERIHPAGVFEGTFAALPGGQIPAYRYEVVYGERTFTLQDPYRFLPTIGELDLHLLGEGRHERLWEVMGAHPRTVDGVAGTSFTVWAPNARSVRVVGDHNSWDGRLHPMRCLGSSGVWELFLPDVHAGSRYKFEIVGADNQLVLKADPYAQATEAPPANASVVYASGHTWGDADWLARRSRREPHREPLAIYELHLGSWRHGLDYREAAHQLADYVTSMGFTHVELMPVAEHPYAPSWGYQVTGYYAPTARFGPPDDFRYLVDHLHQRGIGVIVDWVPAHFPRDQWALARFDGTELYEHRGLRGEHPDWGSLVFNFGRNEVRNFLLANALFWLEELHVDGLRIDAVASMLYLDYSRKPGEWSPNIQGGNEDLDTVSFLRELNSVCYRHHPGVLMIAEESTAWPGVSAPVDQGGLGFGFKWNMGWMHDTLRYISKDPIYRAHHHNDLTFGLVYAFSEQFILPISHDEVVHGKGSLLARMPGDDWQRLANLRAYLGFMWAHPGKKLLFMGSELGQDWEWTIERSIDWDALAYPPKKGVQDLVRTLNASYRDTPALYQRDKDPEGFTWLDATAAGDNVLTFVRWSLAGEPMVCLCNFSPVPRRRRTGLPLEGAWTEVLNTDDQAFGGSGVGNPGRVEPEETPWDGQPFSTELTFPPLATVWLRPARS
jgi:1,4-alpha-glucan branching enzyme